MTKPEKDFVPGLGYHWLTRFYDPVIRAGLRELTIKRALIEQTGIESGHRVLDLGCGTGTLTLLLRESAPQVKITGLDADPQMLAVARKKAAKKAAESGAEIDFRQGLADDLPFEDSEFDRVVSSLMLHHLDRETKRAALREVLRVLRPGGELHLADWGPPRNLLDRAAFFPVRLLDGFEITRDNYEGRLPGLMEEAGFTGSEQTAAFGTVLGPLALFRAVKLGV